MPLASTSRSRVAYIAEVTPGTTPATPTFLTLRRTGGGMLNNKSSIVSDEIRLDRNVIDEIETAVDPTASYDFEFNHASIDDMLAAALFGSWSSNVLTNANVEQSFTVEETVDAGGGTLAYRRMTGAMIDTLSLNIAARSKVTGSVAFMGRQKTLAAAIISGATYTAPGASLPQTANSVASLAVAGLDPVPKVRSLTLNIANNLRRVEQVGSKFTTDFGMGKIDVTGTIEAYFESNTLYQAVLDHGGGALTFTIGAVANQKYTFNLPAIRFLDGASTLGGANDDVMVSIPFRACLDSGISGSIRITRAVA
jgi:hypothetical protein